VSGAVVRLPLDRLRRRGVGDEPRLRLARHDDVVAREREPRRLGNVVEVKARNGLVPREVVLRDQAEPVRRLDDLDLALGLLEAKRANLAVALSFGDVAE